MREVMGMFCLSQTWRKSSDIPGEIPASFSKEGQSVPNTRRGGKG